VVRVLPHKTIPSAWEYRVYTVDFVVTRRRMRTGGVAMEFDQAVEGVLEVMASVSPRWRCPHCLSGVMEFPGPVVDGVTFDLGHTPVLIRCTRCGSMLTPTIRCLP
jgi:hypothetical protein